MKKSIINYLAAVAGILLAGSGLFLLKFILEPQGIMRALPYLCIGLGCGIFGHGMGNIISDKVMKNNPDQQKQIEIEKNDERNIAVANRAKARAYDIMLFVFGALMLAFAVMGVDTAAVLLLVFAYLFVVGCYIYCHVKYNKEM